MSGRPAGLWKATWLVFSKDLRVERRTQARAASLGLFALSALLMFSFAVGPDARLMAQQAGGYLWLALLFSSTLGLTESMRQERENSALEGLRLLPLDARAIFLGKAAGNALFLWALGCVLIPLVVALYDPPLRGGILPLLGVLGLGCLAISAPGTLYAAIASQARSRDALLPLLLLPLLVPALLSAVKATALTLQGDPMGELPSWLGLLTGFNLIYWSLGFVLFPRVVED
jgi:heme exporter protein B